MDHRHTANAPERKRAPRPRFVAAGFLIAFAATVATVILTGLWVRAPESDEQRGAPAADREAPRDRAASSAADGDALDEDSAEQQRDELRDDGDAANGDQPGPATR